MAKTWAPRGGTPFQRHRLGLYYLLFYDNIAQEEVCVFLRELLRLLRGPVMVLLDNSSAHQGEPLRKLLRQHPRLSIEHFPSYAPEPDEGVWSPAKRQLANVGPMTSMSYGGCHQGNGEDMAAISDSSPSFRLIYRNLTSRVAILVFLSDLAIPIGTWIVLRTSQAIAVRRVETLLDKIKELQEVRQLAEEYTRNTQYSEGNCDEAECDCVIFLANSVANRFDFIHVDRSTLFDPAAG